MIPTYNQEAYIREAIESVLTQAYPNLEVIVSDDASTDNTSMIVSSITDSRLKYIRNPQNIWRNTNYRNILYNHATGDYVVNLDGDDYYTDNEFITEAVKLIDQIWKENLSGQRVNTDKLWGILTLLEFVKK